MKKNVVIVLSALIVICVMALFLVLLKTDESNIKYSDEEIKFKEEYESVNGTDYGENVLKTITIDNDNNVKYVSDENIIEILTSGDKVIYFGWPECNWCRTMLPVLVNTLKKNSIDNFYYYNFKALRTAYEEGTNQEKVQIYEEIIDIIGDDITSVFSEDSNRAGEKKILAPTVIFIKDGSYIGLHVKTVDSQIKSSDELTKEQTKELENIYQDYIDRLTTNVCVEEGC